MAVVQCTISGIDSGGFAWSNVFHFQGVQGAGSFFDFLDFVNGIIETSIIPKYQAAANDLTKFLDIGTKGVGADASYTLHKKLALSGSRAVAAFMGAVCPLIRFLPDSGSLVGGMFAVGAGVADFVGDEIQAAYVILLQDLANTMTAFDGTVGPHNLQLVTYNKNGPVIMPMKHNQVPTRPTTLNKRMRA